MLSGYQFKKILQLLYAKPAPCLESPGSQVVPGRLTIGVQKFSPMNLKGPLWNLTILGNYAALARCSPIKVFAIDLSKSIFMKSEPDMSYV